MELQLLCVRKLREVVHGNGETRDQGLGLF